MIAKFVIAGRRFNPGGWLHKINKLKLIQGVSNWFGSNAGSNWGIGSGCLRQKLIHLAKLASGFPFGFLVNVLVDVLREPDVRVSDNLRNNLQRHTVAAEERNAGVPQVLNRCFGRFAAVTSELNSFSILLSSIGVPMVLVNTWPVFFHREPAQALCAGR